MHLLFSVSWMARKLLYSPSKKTQYVFREEEDSGPDSFDFFFRRVSHMNRRAKARILHLAYIALASFVLGFVPVYLFLTSGLSSTHSEKATTSVSPPGTGFEAGSNSGICSSVPNGTLCCDRTSARSDICVMKGDVRTDPASSSVTLYTSDASRGGDESMEFRREKIRPYTRKWETDLMQTINELELTVKPNSDIDQHRCDVRHDVPAVFFSTGGYTGNLYHEFNDGILPLYITSQQMNRKVVFVILEYHNWWMTKYGDVISQLTDFPVIDFYADQRTHCFPEAIVGLKIHGELTIDPTQMQSQKTILDFHDLLGQAYAPRIRRLIEEEKLETEQDPNKPKLVIISRNGSRAITNQDALVKMANEIGFKVEVLSPKRSMELAKIYHILNSSDVVIGVHGAAMTHLIFMKRRAVFIQVIPLGTDWAADSYYGEPARKFGLRYIPYKILPRESSLYRKYHRDDPVLVDPTSVNSKGWEFTKRIYLSHQNVRLNLPRFRKHLLRAYAYCHQIKE